jgi:hypothetical protein
MFTVTVLSGCFLAAVSCKIKKVKAPVITGLLWYIHLVFLFFAALCLLLMISGYGFKGTYTERFFFTFYAGTAIVLYGLTPGDNSGKFAYLCCFFGFPFLLVFGLLLPPLRIFTVVLGLGLLSDGNVENYRIDDDYALRAKTVDILYRVPDYSLIEDKYWLFEKVTDHVVSPAGQLQGLKMEKAGSDSVRLHMNLKGNAGRMGNRIDTTISLHQ